MKKTMHNERVTIDEIEEHWPGLTETRTLYDDYILKGTQLKVPGQRHYDEKKSETILTQLAGLRAKLFAW